MMKSLVSAIALATAMAFAVPAMAQAPAPDANKPTVSKTNAAKPKASKKMAHRPAKAMHAKHAALKAQRHGRMHAAQARPIRHASAARLSRMPGDNVANQLNRQEMQRLSGSGMPQGQSGAQPMYQGQ